MIKSLTTFTKKTGLLQLILSCAFFLAVNVQMKAQTVLFNEDWSSNNFTANGWTFDPSQANWTVGNGYLPIGGTYPNAYFTYNPIQTNYSFALVSPIISATNYTNLTLDFGLYLSNYSLATLEQFKVEYKKTTDVSWTVLYNYTNAAGSNYWNPSNISLIGMDNSSFQIRFVAYGLNSDNINGWGLDNIIVKGNTTQVCAGQPSAGVLTGPSNVCPNQPFTVQSTGYTNASGISFQWIFSELGANNWSIIPGGNTGPSATAQNGINSSKDVRIIATCAASGLSDTSNIFTLIVNPFYDCYCSSYAGYQADEEIYSVTINSANSNTFSGQGNGCNTVAPGPGSMLRSYSNFKTLGAFVQLMKGSTASFTIEENECDGYNYYSFGTAIWIDFNQNGSFSDPGEQVFVENSTALGPRNISNTFSVPMNASTGITAMRVVVSEGNSGASLTPCLVYGYGETEDYLVEITSPVLCSGTPNAGTAFAPSTVCSGGSFLLKDTSASVDNGISYSWEMSPAGLNTWSAIPNATNITYQYMGLNADADFRLVVTCTNSGLSSISNVLAITTTPSITPTVSISESANNICSSTMVTFSSVATGGGLNPNYQWKVNGWNIWGATDSTYTTNWLNNGDNITLDYTTSEQCFTQHTVTSNNIIMNVTPTVNPWVQVIASANQICIGTNVVFSISNSNGGGLNPTYQWYLNGVPVVGETNTSYSSTTINNGDYIYVLMTTSEQCYSQLTAQSNWAWMSVYQYATPSISLSNNINANTACSGTDIYVYANAMNAGAPNYQWYLNSSPINGATDWYYHSTNFNNGDSIWVQVTANTMCLLAPTATSDPMVFTILPKVTPTASIVSNTTNICSGAAVDFTATTSGGGSNPWYGWMINGNIVAWGGSTFSPNYLNNGDNVSLVFYTSEQCYTSQTATSNSLGINVTQTVNPTISINTNNQTTCQGTLVSFTSNGTDGGLNPSYQWYLNGVAVAGETNDTYSSNNFNNNDLVSLEYTTSESCYTVQTVVSNTIQLNVNPLATPVVTIATNNTTICDGTTVIFFSNTPNFGFNPTFQWFLNGVAINGETNPSYTTSSIANGDQVSVEFTTNEQCLTTNTVSSNSITMTVNPNVTPTVSIVTDNNNICEGTNVTFTATPTGEGNNPVYVWNVNGSTFGWGPTYSTTLLNNGDVVFVTLSSSETCVTNPSVASNNLTISVAPSVTPTVSIISDHVISCQGSLVTFTSNGSNGGLNPGYQWYLNGIAVAGETNDTYSSNSFSNNDVISLEYTTSEACYTVQTVTSNNIQLTINAVTQPTINITSSSAVCSGVNTTFNTNVTNEGMTPTYQWEINGTPINGATNSSYTTNGLLNGDNLGVSVTSSNVCSIPNMAAESMLITVIPSVTPTITISADANNVCSGTSVTLTANTTNAGSSPSYSWSVNGSWVFFGTPSITLNNPTNGTVVYAELQSNAACAIPQNANSNNLVLNVMPTVTPTISVVASGNNICSGTAVTFTTNIANGGGNPTYQWYLNGVVINGATNNQYVTNTLSNGDHISCELTSSEICVTSVTATSNDLVMTVFTPSIASIEINTNKDTMCLNSMVNFTSIIGFGGNAPTYQWMLNGLPINGATNNNYASNSLNSLDIITCQLTSNAQCVTNNVVLSNAHEIYIVTPPTLQLTATDISCWGANNGSINVVVTGGLAPFMFNWSGPNGYQSSNQNLNGLAQGLYNLTLINNGGCVTQDGALINQPNQLQTNFSSNSPICAGDPIGLNAVAANYNPGTSIYSWTGPNGFVSNIQNPVIFVSNLNNAGQYSVTITTANGCIDQGNLLINILPSTIYYADADADGYGDPNASVTNCTGMPQGFVLDNTDCNDADPLQHPGQHWYFDNDGDSYGTGADITQCLRPLHGFLVNELAATSGDCDDNNANINPAAQQLTFSNGAGFNNSLIAPQNGSQTTTFQFEVTYTDINNQIPPAFFPRVNLDYEGNGVFNNANDRTVVMNEVDANDLTTNNGKKYYASINNLPTGTNWETRIMINDNGCITKVGPFNYPDVLIQPDLEIFANDITFSTQNPPVSSPLTVSAVVHNNSDFFANNFVVHLQNQYDPAAVYADVTTSLAPHSSTTVSWNITTPALPSWNPMQVTIDASNVIAESNELNNSAIRPFINGNYNLPGGIHAYAGVMPAVSYASNNWLSISGDAYYYDTAVPLDDSSVAGSTVNYTIVETGATYSTYTNSAGHFYMMFPSPGIPGIYHITGTVTDFTLTGNFSTQFEILPSPIPCLLPDLHSGINITGGFIPNTNYVLAGNPVSGNFSITNSGANGTGVVSIAGISQSGGAPILNNFNVPVLASGGNFTQNFNNLVFNVPGTYSLCVEADATNVVNECNESNNTACTLITVLPALPDIYPVGGPGGSNYTCNSQQPYFVVHNAGGVPTGAFSCKLTVSLNGVVNAVLFQNINNIDPLGNVGVTFPYNHPGDGVYTYEINCDWNNVVVESNELNNIGNYIQTLIPCKPDLSLQSCEEFDVQPEDPANNGNITLLATIQNTGNATANGPIQVNFNLSGGVSFPAFFNGNLAPYQTAQVTVQVPAIQPATQTLTAVVDPLNTIDELYENNNTVTGSMCHEYAPVAMCGWNFWGQTYTVNSTANLAVGILSTGLYDAATLKTRFYVSGPGIPGTVNLGNAVNTHLQMTCGCPIAAVLPTNFVFNQVGVYTFTMVTDPDNDYTECNENNNSLTVQVTVTNLPDMRVLSQHIAPSKLNPQINEPISINVTYENIGLGNINDEMKLKVMVDNYTLATVLHLPGLPTGATNTVSLPYTWADSIPGIHVIRAIIDASNQVIEADEMNNEATRAVIVGSSANLYFQAFNSSNPSPAMYAPIQILGRVGNNGDLACAADVELYRIGNMLDTIAMGSIPINVPAHDSVAIQFPTWYVTDPSTVFIGKITNSSTLEYTYDDNTASTEIGTLPVITFVSTPSCSNDSNGTLTAVVNGGEPPYTYYWSNSQYTQSIMGAAGNYTLIVTDLMNRKDTAVGVILDTICQPVCNFIANITASGPLTLCSNGNVTLTATQGTSYLWSNGATTQSITVNTAGTYSAIVTDGNCVDTTETVTVIVKTMPVAAIKIKAVGLTSVCDPMTVSFKMDPYATNYYGFNFQWNLGGSPIQGATDTTYTASGAGGGSITLTVSGSTCTKTAAAKVYTIKPLPMASFTAGSSTTICAGGSVILTAPTIVNYTYTWLKDGVANGSGTAKTVKLAGTYTVIAKLSGCADTSDPVTVVVNPLPLDSVFAATPATFCAGDSCTMTAKPNDATKYRWYLGVNVIDSTNVPTYITKVAGVYKVMVTDQNGCVGKLSTTKVTTKVNPIPTPIITPSGTPVTIAANGNVKLKATPATGVTWQWYKDGVAIANATANYYTATAAGNYTVAVTKLGCTGVSAATIVLQNGVREETATIGAVDNNFEIAAYPNPVSNVLTITISGIDDATNASITILNSVGQLIAFKPISTSENCQLMTENWSSGVYLIRYKDAEGRTGTLKVVKE